MSRFWMHNKNYTPKKIKTANNLRWRKHVCIHFFFCNGPHFLDKIVMYRTTTLNSDCWNTCHGFGWCFGNHVGNLTVIRQCCPHFTSPHVLHFLKDSRVHESDKVLAVTPQNEIHTCPYHRWVVNRNMNLMSLLNS